jgi:hypothetical protein
VPGQWQNVVLQADDKQGDLARVLSERFFLQHARDSGVKIYRGRNPHGLLEYLFSPMAIYQNFNKRCSTGPTELPDIWELETKGYSWSEKPDASFDYDRAIKEFRDD